MKLPVTVISVLPASIEQVWLMLESPDTLKYVAAPKVYFTEDDFDSEWQAGKTYNTLVRRGTSVKQQKYQVTFTEINERAREMRTVESGEGVREWNHFMKLEPAGDEACVYIDRVEIDMGWLTPLAWFWVYSYYRHRHRRWLDLLED